MKSHYGTWNSPITAQKVASGAVSISNMCIDGKNTYWTELRPSNQGRASIVKRDAQGIISDVTPGDFNVRTYVHEYGGGAFTVKNDVIYASSGKDHKIYKIYQGQLEPITDGKTRFADFTLSPFGLVAVGELHAAKNGEENFLALIDIQTGAYKKIATGYDFYAFPTLSPDGKKLAWISWNQPDMPWTNTMLYTADLHSDGLHNIVKVAGNQNEAIFQPQFGPDNTLYFVSDRDSGWWNIHRLQNGNIENIAPIAAEVAEPLWTFGRSTYAFLGDKILFTYNQAGYSHLAVLNTVTLAIETLPYTATTMTQLRAIDGHVQLFQGYAEQAEALVMVHNSSGYPLKSLYSHALEFDAKYISLPQHIEYPSNNRLSYGFFYPPKNKDCQAPDNEKPPLIVMIHGGPTAQARGSFQLGKQYWTSRGFAVLDVNYGGSTGYGREYRQLLDKNWGVVDVEDCVFGAKYLAEQGLVDPNKLVIRGGSAGGYTTLAALAFQDIFKAGASHYGVADIQALAQDTHKFERWYMEGLVGKYPEEAELWRARSPIHSVDKIHVPLILFQGEEDAIVPKNQSEMIYQALQKNGITTELYIYPEEQHGFRKAENIIHSLTKELEFYQKVFAE